MSETFSQARKHEELSKDVFVVTTEIDFQEKKKEKKRKKKNVLLKFYCRSKTQLVFNEKKDKIYASF